MSNLGEVGALAQALLEAERAVEVWEAEGKVLAERVRKLKEEDLPGAMQEVGLEKVKLPDGTEIGVKQEVYVAMTNAQKPLAYAWLEEHGHGGLIKTQITAMFGRGEEEAEKVQELVRALNEQGIDCVPKTDVHAQTMKAWLREQLADPEKAAGFPLDLFGARPVTVATVKVPKG